MSGSDKLVCADCRYFSERIARAHHGCATYLEALCLSDRSPYRQQYMRENSSCCFGVRGPAVDAYEQTSEQ